MGGIVNTPIILLLCFIGIKDMNGKLQTTKGEGIFSIVNIHRAMRLLYVESPHLFKELDDFSVDLVRPYSKNLEKILSELPPVIYHNDFSHRISEDSKERIFKELFARFGEEELRDILPVVEKLRHLMYLEDLKI